MKDVMHRAKTVTATVRDKRRTLSQRFPCPSGAKSFFEELGFEEDPYSNEMVWVEQDAHKRPREE